MIRWARPIADVGLGVPSGLAEILFLLSGLVLRREAFLAYAGRIAAWELRRLGLPPTTIRDRRAVAYLAARFGPTVLGALTVGVLAVGVVLAVIVISAFAGGRMTLAQLAFQVFIGAALLLINLQAIASVRTFDRWLATELLDSGDRERLRERITELTVSRAAVLEAVDAERRRIERDLHDGLQQRLVALGVLLGRARRSTDETRAAELVTRAHEDVQRAIDDLREVAWRVYPSALDHSTLDEVLTMVARGAGLPVRIRYALDSRPPREVETVLYFVACEAITNAAKHAGATVITISLAVSSLAPDGVVMTVLNGVVTTVPDGVVMTVLDDGAGGADPTGSGLAGLARRVEALDGRFTVDSPPGGPTTIRAELPCA